VYDRFIPVLWGDFMKLGLAGNVSITGATILVEFASEHMMNGWYFMEKAGEGAASRPHEYSDSLSLSGDGATSAYNMASAALMQRDGSGHGCVHDSHGLDMHITSINIKTDGHDYSQSTPPKATRSTMVDPTHHRGSNIQGSPTVARFRLEAWDSRKSAWTTVGAPAWTHSGGLQFFDQTKRDANEYR
jgi:hypothetical protein